MSIHKLTKYRFRGAVKGSPIFMLGTVVKSCFLLCRVWVRVVRRVLVLIQVGLAALARDKHTPKTKLDRRNTEKSSADGCEVAAEPLGDPSHFSVGADVDFMEPGWSDVLPSVSLLHLLDHLGTHLPDIHSIHKAGEVIEKQKLLILHPNGTHHVVIQYIGFEILGEPT